jgi:Fe-Mn family superoxide dismutase
VDVYEHAYYLDFQNRPSDYVDGFTDHIDWIEVERRLRLCLG